MNARSLFCAINFLLLSCNTCIAQEAADYFPADSVQKSGKATMILIGTSNALTYQKLYLPPIIDTILVEALVTDTETRPNACSYSCILYMTQKRYPSWEKAGYLDADKKPLKKSIHVWISVKK